MTTRTQPTAVNLTTGSRLAFASDVGLAPGQWPVRIQLSGGEIMHKRHTHREPGGDISSVTYALEHAPGVAIEIAND